MAQLVLALFPKPDAVSNSECALRALHGQGVVTLFAAATLLHQAGHRSVVVRDPIPRAEAPAAPSLGSALAGLVVVLGGLPAAAMLTTGAGMVAVVSDLAEAGLGSLFLERIAEEFRSGHAALVAEIEEDNPLALDALVTRMGGLVLRPEASATPEGDVIAHLQAYHAQDAMAGPATAQAATPTARNRIDERRRLLRKAAVLEASLRREADAKVQVLRRQAAALEGEARATVERRAHRLHDALTARIARLHDVIDAARPAQRSAATLH